MIKKTYSNQSRIWRHQRVRKRVSGTPSRPRLAVFRSANQIYAQVIDDTLGTTLVAASSREAELAEVARRAPARPERAKPVAKPAEPAAPAAESAEPAPKGGKGDAKAGAKGGKSDAKAGAKAEAKGGAKAEARASAPAAKAEEPDDGTPTGLRGIEENRRVAQARLVGLLVAERAKAHGIERVVFDRGGYIYHGRVAALATGAREGGLDF